MSPRTSLLPALAVVLTAGSAWAQPTSSTPGPSAPPVNEPPPPAAPITPTAPRAADKLIEVGARVGLNIASVNSEPEQTFLESRSGLSIGGFARLAVQPSVSVEIGVGYTQRGFRSPANIEGSTEYEIEYFEIPATVQGRFDLSGTPLDLRLIAGLGVLILDAARIREEFGATTPIEDLLADYDVELLLGAAVDYDLGDLKALVEIRLGFGLIDVAEGPVIGASLFNRNIGVLAGLAF